MSTQGAGQAGMVFMGMFSSFIKAFFMMHMKILHKLYTERAILLKIGNWPTQFTPRPSFCWILNEVPVTD